MQDISSLEKLENDAAGIVTGKPVLFHKLYRECGWDPLHTRT